MSKEIIKMKEDAKDLLESINKETEEREVKKAALWNKLKTLASGQYAGKEEEFEAIDEMRKVIFKLERLI